MSEGEPPTRLDDLDVRLRRLRERTSEEDATLPSGEPQSSSAAGFALRIGIELLAALMVGGGIGWLLDYWLGTLPLFLIVFFLLGACAGMLNVFRAGREMNR
jgi:ATP synthase protein I